MEGGCCHVWLPGSTSFGPRVDEAGSLECGLIQQGSFRCCSPAIFLFRQRPLAPYVAGLVVMAAFASRVARVCRLWYGAASNPTLWQKVSLGYCWAPSGRKQSPAVQKKVLSTVEWLAGSR